MVRMVRQLPDCLQRWFGLSVLVQCEMRVAFVKFHVPDLPVAELLYVSKLIEAERTPEILFAIVVLCQVKGHLLADGMTAFSVDNGPCFRFRSGFVAAQRTGRGIKIDLIGR